MGVILSASCLLGCTEARVQPADAISGPSPSGVSFSGPTATAAYKQNWNCQRIERAIANLVEPMQLAKARAKMEEQKIAPTLARMLARLAGPPGAGNAALAEYQHLRSDADQLNELLREKGCASFTIDIGAPLLLLP